MKATDIEGLSQASTARRHILGLYLSSGGCSLSGVVLATLGLGLNARVGVMGVANFDIPDHMKGRWPWNGTGPSAQRSPHDCAAFVAEVSEFQASLVQHLLAQTRLDSDQVLVIGAHDPGWWHEYSNGQRASISLCDAARLAEATGLNVIDSFPARDLAQGGRGGPLWPLPLLLLFGHEMCRVNDGGWLVVDLRRRVHLYCFSAPRASDKAGVLFQTVQPGMALVDLLVEQLTSGREHFDAGGRWAVQGRRIASLIDEWSRLDVFNQPPDWSPHEVVAEDFLSIFQQAGHSHRTLQDALCSATHLVADGIYRAVHQAIPEPSPTIEGMLIGRGRQNGMLLRELGVRLPDVSWKSPADYGLNDDAVRAAMVAILAMLHVDHIPGNVPEITGAETPRILGRLTPGTPRHWRRLLAEMAANRPQMMTLRYAI